MNQAQLIKLVAETVVDGMVAMSGNPSKQDVKDAQYDIFRTFSQRFLQDSFAGESMAELMTHYATEYGDYIAAEMAAGH